MAQEKSVARLRFIVLSPSGDEMPYYVDGFVNTRTGANLASGFKGLSAAAVPFGLYRYRLLREDVRGDAGWLSGQIDVSRAEALKVLLGSEINARVGGQPAAADVGPVRGFAILGVINPPPGSGAAVWVRLTGLYQDYRLDVAVGPDGTFRIDEPLGGLFMMTIHKGGAVLGARLLAFKQGSRSARFAVNLGDASITTTDVKAAPE